MKTSATILVIASAAFAVPASAAPIHRHHRHRVAAYQHSYRAHIPVRLSRYGEPGAPYFRYGRQPPPIYYLPIDNPPGSIIFRKTIEAQSEPGVTSELAPDAKQTATGGPVGGIPGFGGGFR